MLFDLKKNQVPAGEIVVNEDVDRRKLDEVRMRYLLQKEQEYETQESNQLSTEEVGSLGMPEISDGEADFNLEVSLQGLESDKYRPRKPRYFNKIQTGYFWNRYNRTHYDSDNPPPKMVLGYRFNIFYPDLIDKFVMLQYTITPCQDNKNLCIIRFTAGPPYEDIAFQIVNDREWDQSERHGFRNWYRRGVLQLWFRFKKMPYRR